MATNGIERRSPGSGVRRLARGVGVALALCVGSVASVRGEDDGTPVPHPATAENLPDAAELDAHAASGCASDDDLRALLGQLRQAVLEQGASRVRELDRTEVMSFAVRPVIALELARATFEDLPAIRQRDPGGAQGYVEKVGLVGKALARRKATPEGTVAIALFRVDAQLDRALGKLEPDLAELKAASAELRKQPALLGIGATRWATTWMAAAKAAAPTAGFSAWVSAEVAFVLKQNPKETALANEAAWFDLRWSSAEMETDPKAAGPALVRALAAFAAPDAIPAKDRELVTLYNGAIGAARAAGLTTKAKYVTATIKSSRGLLTAEVPAYTPWEAGRVDGDQEVWKLTRIGSASGGVVITVYKYSVRTDYVDDEGKVIGGDNIGARMKQAFDAWKSQVDKVKKIAPNSGKVSKGIPAGRGFEVRGRDEDGDEFRAREWYWKGELHSNHVFNLTVLQTGGDLDRDAEVELFLESLRETNG